MTRSGRGVAAALLALVVLVAAGCDGDDEGSSTTTGTTPVETTPETTFLAVYLLRDGKIAPVRRSVEATPGVARASLEALLEGPTSEERAGGLVSAIPEGTRLLDIAVADGVATVDLSGEFDDGGGSASMQARVAQVVATLTRFPTIERVGFRLDGEDVDAIGGEGSSSIRPSADSTSRSRRRRSWSSHPCRGTPSRPRSACAGPRTSSRRPCRSRCATRRTR